ncbi:hypothetical protein BH23VER1_BH23VER1_34420 [soil metagenome]
MGADVQHVDPPPTGAFRRRRSGTTGTGGTASSQGTGGPGSDFAFRHEPPPIPDHEVLRCIGKGSYGEVWMARGVTGALRAIKVVHRGDFELDRTFEREFEGIKSFEPISRTHPGLVDILHVGRNLEYNFYYCVMELADDQEAGPEIVPAEYVPRTLGSDIQARGKLGLEQCIESTAAICDALEHLHSHGLSHRDIKPSNVIFVNGKAKLADIGLVAASGQRTFVGTEGFVPPEGPGTPQADVFSLGMVLYEISTGKDRMNFPELPTALGLPKHREKWIAINEVVCRACAPSPKKRFKSAAEMGAAMRAIDNAQLRPMRFPATLALPVLSALAAALIVTWKSDGRSTVRNSPPQGAERLLATPRPEPVERLTPATLEFVTEPNGATVWEGDQLLGTTPFSVEKVAPGTHQYVLRRDNYKDLGVTVNLVPGGERLVSESLERWSPPLPGRPWENSLGMQLEPRGREHVAVLPTLYIDFTQLTDFLEGEAVPITAQDGSTQFAVYVPEEDAESFCAALTAMDQELGYLGSDHRYRVEPYDKEIDSIAVEGSGKLLAFYCVVYHQEFGKVEIRSNPPGAEVYSMAGEMLGVAPLSLPPQETGFHQYQLRLPGHTTATVGGELKPNGFLRLNPTLEESGAVVFGKPWQNSLEMRFLPIDEGVDNLMISALETRIRDYQAYARQSELPMPPGPGFDQGQDHPQVNVTRDEATAFCNWLTARDRAAGIIEEFHEYRLPTDAEWSLAVGIDNERGEFPSDRNERTYGIFPWGLGWPPPPGSGNFADGAFAESSSADGRETIAEYHDGFAQTSPSGYFSAAPNGTYDLAGNVWEWVADPYHPTDPSVGVLRGGSWMDASRDDLRSSHRLAAPADGRDVRFGFRTVLAISPDKVTGDPPDPPGTAEGTTGTTGATAAPDTASREAATDASADQPAPDNGADQPAPDASADELAPDTPDEPGDDQD